MASIGELIEFLMSLMSDDETKAAFERDPEATLASKGLSGVTEQDVQDARLIMAEGGGHAGHASHAAQPQHITRTNEIDIDQTVVDIDDRDTTVIDSFNSDDEVVAIQDNSRVVNVEDSFNETPEGGASPGDEEEGFESEPDPEPEPEPEPEMSIQPVEDEPDLEPDPELPVG